MDGQATNTGSWISESTSSYEEVDAETDPYLYDSDAEDSDFSYTDEYTADYVRIIDGESLDDLLKAGRSSLNPHRLQFGRY